MFKTKWTITFAVVLCALLLPFTAWAKKPAEQRGLSTHGEATIIIDLNPLSPTFLQWTKTYRGWGSHVGHYEGEGGGTGLTGSGWFISTQGEEVYWDVVLQPMTINPDGTVTILADATITGGTGRFSGITGYFSLEYNGTVAVDESGVATLTLTYKASGRLTY